jgi:hypothetical protein
MRTMLLHRTSEGLPDYFYCTDCGWVHTEARFRSEYNPQVTYHQEVAEAAFKKHECAAYTAPRGSLEWAMRDGHGLN